MSRTYKQNVSHVNVSVTLTVANVTRLKIRIMINVSVNVKILRIIKRVKNIIKWVKNGYRMRIESFYM